jgi:hypothetical protein
MEMCQDIKTIIYVFTEVFSQSNFLLLKSLYELVGQSNVLLMMNKLSRIDLEQLPQLMSSISAQLVASNSTAKIEPTKFFMMGVKFRDPELPLDLKGCLSHLHNYLGMKPCYRVRDLNYEHLPSIYFKSDVSVIISKPYEMVVNPDVKEDYPSYFKNQQKQEQHKKNNNENNILHPNIKHFREYATFINKYKVRHDGNFEFIGKPTELPGTRRREEITFTKKL